MGGCGWDELVVGVANGSGFPGGVVIGKTVAKSGGTRILPQSDERSVPRRIRRGPWGTV